jgi:hypothetical protein
MKAIVLGALTAVLVIMILLTVSMYIVSEENKAYHTAEITVTGKVCNDEAFGVHVSKIQGDDGTVYFVPNADCGLYSDGNHSTVIYNHICNLPVKEPSPMSWACFNRIVGDYP